MPILTKTKLIPFNPDTAGGDWFDLQTLIDHPLVQTGAVDLNHICYIRLIDIIGNGSQTDSMGHPIYDPTFGVNGADIDAVGIRNYQRYGG